MGSIGHAHILGVFEDRHIAINNMFFYLYGLLCSFYHWRCILFNSLIIVILLRLQMNQTFGGAFGGIDNDQQEIKARQRHRARLDPKPRYPSKDFHHKEFAKKLRDGFRGGSLSMLVGLLVEAFGRLLV